MDWTCLAFQPTPSLTGWNGSCIIKRSEIPILMNGARVLSVMEFVPLKFGKYTLLDRIAVGGMAELYRALISGDQGFEKLIAVKRLLPHLAYEESVVTSFIDEAKLAALLQHRNIVQIYDFGSMEGSYFIAMEYLFGKDLHAVMKKAGGTERSLGLENALCITCQICEGLDYAHGLKDLQGNPLRIIHRDVSPQNICINYGGEVKIIDFGIAKASSQSSSTQLGTIKGKVTYMSPEQAKGEPIDHRSDVFATGIILYEMVTRTRMFSGDAMEVLSQVREARFVPPEEAAPGLPTEIYSILHRALSADPKERYQTCGEMYADLDECIRKRSLRPSTHALALFMKDLYEAEIVTEELTIQEVMKIEARGQIALKEARTGDPDKTIVLGSNQPPKNGRPWKRYAVTGIPLLIAMVFLITFYVLWRPGYRLEGPIAAQAPAGTGIPASITEGDIGEPAELKAGLEALEDGRYQEAAALFKEAIEKDPAMRDKLAEPYDRALREAASALQDSDPEKAEKLLLDAVDVNPESIPARFRLGLLYLALKEYHKAKEAFEEAARLDPSFADTYFNLGYVNAMIRDYDKAEEMFYRVVELAPMYLDEAYFNLAMVQEKAGKIEESLLNLEQALTVNPENRPAWNNLERLKNMSGNP